MATKELNLRFKLERETKNTVRYEEVEENGGGETQPKDVPVLRTLYIAKHALGGGRPTVIRVTISLPDPMEGGGDRG